MHLADVQDGHNGIQQSQFAALVAKTNMADIEARVAKAGAQEWREFVKRHSKSLAKSSTTTGVTTALGLNFIDLRAPAYMLDPIFAHLRNSTPRWDKVNAGYGCSPSGRPSRRSMPRISSRAFLKATPTQTVLSRS